ncbi:hypothetical protein B0H14DRAFT_2915674 [Mycena olivaceomarginata]|nr:hypothetical protein B0H14DRAFT_2915674 [Mycena olivaceomarginata]
MATRWSIPVFPPSRQSDTRVVDSGPRIPSVCDGVDAARPQRTAGTRIDLSPTLCLFKSGNELNLRYSRRALPASLVVSSLAFDWAARSTEEKQTRLRSPLLPRIALARSPVRRYRMLLPARSRCSCEGTVWTSHHRIADIEWPRGTGADARDASDGLCRVRLSSPGLRATLETIFARSVARRKCP